jgi:hypothetical protein
MFEHNTTQFFCGLSVLRSDGLNHINHRVHCVHLELTTKRLKTFPTKEPQRATPVAALVEASQNHFDNLLNGDPLITPTHPVNRANEHPPAKQRRPDKRNYSRS